MPEKKPIIIFKYKQLLSEKDLKRLSDTIKNNRLFFPTPSQLNDPLEGAALTQMSGFAGFSLFQNADEEFPFIRDNKERFRVLSFSTDCFSPQMWAYYCNNYNGIVLCYNTLGSFSDVVQVVYQSSSKNNLVLTDENWSEDMLRKTLTYKNPGWRHEKEWRLIKKTDEQFFYYRESDFVGVIIGHLLPEEFKNELKSIIPENIPILRTNPGLQSRKIGLLPFDYKMQYDGRINPIIYNTEFLFEYLNSKDKEKMLQDIQDKHFRLDDLLRLYQH